MNRTQDNRNVTSLGFTTGTQLLTPKGWKDVSEITLEDYVIQWSPDGSMEFVRPTEVFSSATTITVQLQNGQGHVNQEILPDHRIVNERRGIIKESLASNYASIQNRNTSNFINTGVFSSEGVGLTVRERLLIAIQADGYYNLPEKRTGERIGAVPAMFSFAKQRKSERLIHLAAEAGLRLDDRRVDKRGRQNWALYVPSRDQLLWPRDKRLSSIADLDTVSGQWCKEFIDEAALWDGHEVKENMSRITWRSIIQENTDYLQAVASLSGYRTHFKMHSDDRKESYSDIYTVQIGRHLNLTSVQSVKHEIDQTPKMIHGVKVPSHYLLIRREGGVSVIGDSHR